LGMFRGELFEYVVNGGTDKKWPVRRSAKGLYCVYDIVSCMLEKEVDRAHTFKKACADNFPAVAEMDLAKDQFGTSRVPGATKEQASKIVDFIRAAMTIPGVRKMRSVDDLVLPESDREKGRTRREELVRVFCSRGQVFTHVRDDGFFNAFQMVGAVSKAWTMFARDDAATRTHLAASLEAKGLDWFDAVKRSCDGCVWVHPDVAVALAGWCDPEFVPRVRKYVDAAADFDAALAESAQEARVWDAILGRKGHPSSDATDLQDARDKHSAVHAESVEASRHCAACWKDVREAEARALAADKAAHDACQKALQARFELAKLEPASMYSV
jgi:hypothetical protein